MAEERRGGESREGAFLLVQSPGDGDEGDSLAAAAGSDEDFDIFVEQKVRWEGADRWEGTRTSCVHLRFG